MSVPSQSTEQHTGASPAVKKAPLVILVVGMAGTGKTTLVHRLQHYTRQAGIASFFVNLDPAVRDVPFTCNIDVRDTVNYREVMRQYKLGPNGGIMTALNLFATKVHQVVEIIEKKPKLDWVVVDTPGQIEVFTWSASGQMISEAFASTFPTTILFVADTSRCTKPQVFLSSMVYASSILFKSQLPLVVAFNKCDVVGGEECVRWLRDHDAFADASHGQKGYSATLTASLALFLHHFYEATPCVTVSAATGSGMDELKSSLETARDVYLTEFVPLMRRKEDAKHTDEMRRLEAQLEAVKADRQT